MRREKRRGLVFSDSLKMQRNDDSGDDPADENYVPTIFSYKEKPVNAERENRAARRNIQKDFKDAECKQKEQEKRQLSFSTFIHSSYTKSRDEEPSSDTEGLVIEPDDVDIGVRHTRDAGVQCDPDPLLLENLALKSEIRRLQGLQWSVDKIKDDDTKTKFYTGLPSFAVFLWLFNYLVPKCEKMVYWRGTSMTPTERARPRRLMSLEPIDQFLATLMRLKVGLFVEDIAERFGVSVGTYSQYFTTWVCLLYQELRPLNPFPSRDIIQRNMPSCFHSFPNLRVILDCTEIFVQKSSSLVNQNLSFSHYKHHTTIKFLIGITPSGVISLISEGFGGRVSDRQMIEKSLLLDML
uniref:Transposase Helix-turn-helix domain-containing protein n=1 Tax=Magallana gigas TaxID=29159 RepID=A0A8W8JS03_MAGGI